MEAQKEVCKVAVRGLGADGGHVWTPGRGWPVGSDTIMTVIEADEDPAPPAELTANKLGEIGHPSIIGKVTLRLLERHPSLSVRVVDGKPPEAPPADLLAAAVARAEIADAKHKEAEALLVAAQATIADLSKARDGMGDKIKRLEAQVAGSRRG